MPLQTRLILQPMLFLGANSQHRKPDLLEKFAKSLKEFPLFPGTNNDKS